MTGRAAGILALLVALAALVASAAILLRHEVRRPAAEEPSRDRSETRSAVPAAGTVAPPREPAESPRLQRDAVAGIREPGPNHAERPLRVVLENTPPHFLRSYDVSARVRVLRNRTGEPIRDGGDDRGRTARFDRRDGDGTTVVDLPFPVDAHGTVEISAEHPYTGWRTLLASRAVGSAEQRVVIDLTGNLQALNTSTLRAVLHLPDDLPGTFVLSLAHSGSSFVRAVEATRPPGQATLTVWAHGLGSGTYSPVVQWTGDGPVRVRGRWRARFAPVEVRGETAVELRPGSGGTIAARVSGNPAAPDTQPPWITIQHLSSALPAANSQRWTGSGQVVVTGLASGEYLLQVAGDRVASHRSKLWVHGAGTMSIDLDLVPASVLILHAIACQPGTLSITDLATRREVPLGARETGIQGRLHKVRLPLPRGSYELTVRRRAGDLRRTVELDERAETLVVIRGGQDF